MNKKNIGAALSVVAAVSAGATVYASTINNLESDRNTNSMIKPYYSDTTYDYYSLVKSDYTNDLKNTAISNEKRVVQNTNETFKETLKVEKAAKDIVATTINVAKQENKEQPVKEVVETIEETTYEQPVYEDEVAVDEEENLVSEAARYIEETEEAPAVEEETEEDELVVYDDTNLDEVLVDEEISEPAVEKNEVAAQVEYLDNNQEVSEETRYINVDALNIRSSKTMDDASNIVRTLTRGDEVIGVVEGDWFKTSEGYLSLYYLATEKPAPIVNEEAEVEEAVVEETPEDNIEEEAPIVEETPVVEEAPAVEEAKEVKGQAYTGYVYNTKTLNVRTAAKTGNILGTLKTGTEVIGELIDGWVKFDYNGSVAYVSGAYLTTTKPEVEKVSETIKEEVAPAIEEVLYEEDIKVEEVAEAVAEVVEEVAPVVNNGQSIASIASRYAGHPYVWGSSNPAVGFDCSGLVVNAYRELGINLPHQSAAQYNSGYAVDASNLQPGDLVFFKMRGGNIDHVGIVTSSDGTFIHASTPTTGVVFDNVYNNHYQKSFVGARRIF